MDGDKKEIVDRFYSNVRGRKPQATGDPNHCGDLGHWLERQMGVQANASNTPDLLGYEMKSQTRSKTSFGDWSADWYVFRAGYGFDRDHFLEIFGKSNPKKDGRYSWSGEPCPKVDVVNSFGQMLYVDDDNNILALYYFTKDKRSHKQSIVPTIMQDDDLILAQWNEASMRRHVESKFNQKGWFKCKTNPAGKYDTICFGSPINFETWIKFVKTGVIFLDSGMYQGNSRNYSQWRANNTFWDSLIVDVY